MFLGITKVWLMHLWEVLFARTDPNVLLIKRDELVWKCQHRGKFTLKCLKDRENNLFFLSACCAVFFILGKNPAESHLMIENTKYSVMIICCFYLPTTCYTVLLYIILRTLPDFVYHQLYFYKYQSFPNFVANVF